MWVSLKILWAGLIIIYNWIISKSNIVFDVNYEHAMKGELFASQTKKKLTSLASFCVFSSSLIYLILGHFMTFVSVRDLFWCQVKLKIN